MVPTSENLHFGFRKAYEEIIEGIVKVMGLKLCQIDCSKGSWRVH